MPTVTTYVPLGDPYDWTVSMAVDAPVFIAHDFGPGGNFDDPYPVANDWSAVVGLGGFGGTSVITYPPGSGAYTVAYTEGHTEGGVNYGTGTAGPTHSLSATVRVQDMAQIVCTPGGVDANGNALPPRVSVAHVHVRAGSSPPQIVQPYTAWCQANYTAQAGVTQFTAGGRDVFTVSGGMPTAQGYRPFVLGSEYFVETTSAAGGRAGSLTVTQVNLDHGDPFPASYLTPLPPTDRGAGGTMYAPTDTALVCGCQAAIGDIALTVKARRWPSGVPIAGLPVQVKASSANGHGGFNLPGEVAAARTDAGGAFAPPMAPRPPGFGSPWLIASTPLSVAADTTALRTGADQVIARYTPPDPVNSPSPNSYDAQGWVELKRWPGLVRFTRLPSYPIFAPGDVRPWSGTAAVDAAGLPVAPLAGYELNWQLTPQSDGLHALYPAAKAYPHGYSGRIGGSGLAATYGVHWTLADTDGRRRAFHNYRYVRLRVHCPVPGTLALKLLGGSYIDGNGNPQNGAGYSFLLSAQVGENVWTVDLCDPAQNPFGTDIHGNPITRGWLNGWPDTQARLPDYHTPVTDGPDSNYFAAAAIKTVGLDGMLPGAEYVIEEVTLTDRTGDGRTPLRVLGSSHPAPPIEVDSGFGAPTPPRDLLRVLANGRPVACVPFSPPDAGAVNPGDRTFHTVDDLIAQWQSYFDAGSGVWTVESLNPALTSVLPAFCVEADPASVTETAFTLDGVVGGYGVTLSPGFELTVSDSLDVYFDLGGQAEGILLADASRAPGAGKTVSSSVQVPPSFEPDAGVLAQEADTAADADGYFALAGLTQTHFKQLLNPFTLGDYYPPHVFNADDDPLPTTGFGLSAGSAPQHPVPHRTALFFTALARLKSAAFPEQDIAQDAASGRIHLVATDEASGDLTATTYEGHTGFSAIPTRDKVALLDAATGLPRQGRAPSLWVSHEDGVASLLYAQGDGTGPIVRADSNDGLQTLGAESVALFSRSGGYPSHFRDSSTGVLYAFAAFDNATGGTQDILLVRQDAQGNALTWADGTTEKVIAAGLAAAGRPVALANRYDPTQMILLQHGDVRYSSADNGETWSLMS